MASPSVLTKNSINFCAFGQQKTMAAQRCLVFSHRLLAFGLTFRKNRSIWTVYKIMHLFCLYIASLIIVIYSLYLLPRILLFSAYLLPHFSVDTALLERTKASKKELTNGLKCSIKLEYQVGRHFQRNRKVMCLPPTGKGITA